MLTKAWIAVLVGLLLGTLFFSTGCDSFGEPYPDDPSYGTPASTLGFSGASTGGTPGWKPAGTGATTSEGAANGGGAPASGS